MTDAHPSSDFRCSVCGEWRYVPSRARDCEASHEATKAGDKA
jgi:hypothetical protein